MEKNTSRCLTQKAPYKGPDADSEEKQEPVSDIDITLVDSPKALDPNRPIREADMCSASGHVCFGRWFQLVTATPVVVYRREFRIPRSPAGVD